MFLNGFVALARPIKIGLGFVVVVKSSTISIFSIGSRFQKLSSECFISLTPCLNLLVRCIVCCTLYSKHGIPQKSIFLVEQATKKMKKEENNDLSRLTFNGKRFYQLTFKYGFSILTGKIRFFWYRENYRGLFESSSA
jgi:hypothetical protein